MPHYQDGTQARVGDHVVGKPYNTDHQVAGTVVSISPLNDACNLQVEFIKSVPVKIQGVTGTDGELGADVHVPRPSGAIDDGRCARSENHSSSGRAHVRFVCRDYGAVSDFRLVARPGDVEA